MVVELANCAAPTGKQIFGKLNPATGFGFTVIALEPWLLQPLLVRTVKLTVCAPEANGV